MSIYDDWWLLTDDLWLMNGEWWMMMTDDWWHSVTNIRIFEYFLPRIFVRIIFVSFFWYEYIRIFVRIIFLIRIYSDIRSYHIFHIIECWIFGYSNIFRHKYSFISYLYPFFDTNIFGHSFVLFFSIRIYSDIRSYQNFIFVTLWYQCEYRYLHQCTCPPHPTQILPLSNVLRATECSASKIAHAPQDVDRQGLAAQDVE